MTITGGGRGGACSRASPSGWWSGGYELPRLSPSAGVNCGPGECTEDCPTDLVRADGRALRCSAEAHCLSVVRGCGPESGLTLSRSDYQTTPTFILYQTCVYWLRCYEFLLRGMWFGLVRGFCMTSCRRLGLVLRKPSTIVSAQVLLYVLWQFFQPGKCSARVFEATGTPIRQIAQD